MHGAVSKTKCLAVITVVWMVLIFMLSAQDATKSSNVSDAFTRLILNLLEPGEHTESPSDAENGSPGTASDGTDTLVSETENGSVKNPDSSSFSKENESKSDEDNPGTTPAVPENSSGKTDKDDEAAEVFSHGGNSKDYDPVPNRDWLGIPKTFFKSFVRKAAHFCMFLGLGILVLCTVRSYYGKPHWRVYASAWLICVFYALCDEFHQLFVPGRGAEFTDVCIDSSGALVGIFLIFLFFAARTKLQRKKEQGIG